MATKTHQKWFDAMNGHFNGLLPGLSREELARKSFGDYWGWGYFR